MLLKTLLAGLVLPSAIICRPTNGLGSVVEDVGKHLTSTTPQSSFKLFGFHVTPGPVNDAHTTTAAGPSGIHASQLGQHHQPPSPPASGQSSHPGQHLIASKGKAAPDVAPPPVAKWRKGKGPAVVGGSANGSGELASISSQQPSEHTARRFRNHPGQKLLKHVEGSYRKLRARKRLGPCPIGRGSFCPLAKKRAQLWESLLEKKRREIRNAEKRNGAQPANAEVALHRKALRELTASADVARDRLDAYDARQRVEAKLELEGHMLLQVSPGSQEHASRTVQYKERLAKLHKALKLLKPDYGPLDKLPNEEKDFPPGMVPPRPRPRSGQQQ